MTEEIAVHRDRYEDEVEKLEGELSSIVEQMRSAPNVQSLQTLLAQARQLVGPSGSLETGKILSSSHSALCLAL